MEVALRRGRFGIHRKLMNAATNVDMRQMRVGRMIVSGLVGVVGLGLGVFSVASFGVLALSDTGDMSTSGVIELGLIYGLMAAAVVTVAWRLWPRRPH